MKRKGRANVASQVRATSKERLPSREVTRKPARARGNGAKEDFMGQTCTGFTPRSSSNC
jgi:hypothetical protein